MRSVICALFLIASVGRADLLESLTAAQSPEARRALIQVNADAVRATVLPALHKRARTLARESKAADGRRLLDIIDEAVEILKIADARGDRLLTEGMVLGAEGKPNAKLAALRQSRKAYAALEPPHRRGEARCLIEIGRELDRGDDVMPSARAFVEAVRIYRELKDESAEGNLLAETAALLVRHQAFAQALPICDRAIEILARRRELPGLVVATRQRGIARMRLNRSKAALQDFAGVLAYRQQRGGTPAELATAMMEFGDCLVALFRIADARKTYGELLRHARNGKLRGFEADVLLRLGNLETAGSDGQLAKLEAARLLFVELQRPYEIASCWNFLGDARLSRGEFQSALKCYRDARATVEHPLVKVNALIGEVNVMRTFGRLDEALTAFEMARAACKALRDGRWPECMALMAGAEVLAARGENASSIKAYDTALGICGQLGYEQGTAQVLVRRARELARLGDRNGAIQDYFKAIKLVPSAAIGAEAAVGAAEVLYEARQLEAALTVAREGVRLSRAHKDQSVIARAYLVLSRLLILGHDLKLVKEAEQALAEADRIGTQLGAPLLRAEATRLRAMAAAGRNDAAAAERLLREALGFVRGQPARHLTWRIHLTLARIHEANGKLEAATVSMRTAVQDLDAMRGALGGGEAARQDFMRRSIHVFESLAELLGKLIEQETDAKKKQALIEEAMALVARARFERFSPRGVRETGSDKLNEVLAKYRQAERDRARQREEQAKALAAGNNARAKSIGVLLAKTEERLGSLYVDLKTQDKDLGTRLRFDPRRVTDGMFDAPEGATLVVYFPGEKNLFVWVFDHTGFKEWRQVPVGRKELYTLVKRYRDRIAEVVRYVADRKPMGKGFGEGAESDEGNPAWYRANIKETREVLRALHGYLLAPIARHVEQADPLMILPYGELSYLPFEALIGPKGEFVGATKRLAYFTSEHHLAEALRDFRSEPRRRDDVWVAFADPRGRMGSALEEAAEIKAFFAKAEVHTSQTGTAGEEQVLALREDCTILHFATHGILNGHEPSQTYLEMDKNSGNGQLEQGEVWPRLKRRTPAFRKRNVRLVVLSACKTARAQNNPEAEVLGMPDAFVMVGAPAVIASLWSVYTYSTTDLMVEFYRRHIKDKKNAAVALQEARNAVLNARKGRYAHPFYWAPFLLFGDWR